MPTARIILESPIASSFRVEQVRGMFDVPDRTAIRHEWNVDIPVEGRDWSIGLVVGPSGSGKTTIGRRLFPDAHFHDGYDWPTDKAVVDGFPSSLDGKTITQALSSVGFSSPPHWIKRYTHLSNGQRFRCELARLMLEDADTIVFDEFTSVVDRDAAKISSAAVANTIRRRGSPRLIALSCHYDIIDWLDPDWIYDTANMAFDWRSLRGRPPIGLQIHQASASAWRLFRGHHYLSRDINGSARCFVANWDGNPVAFTSFIHFPHARVRNIKREHRTVVLPDYQGIGIGNRLSEWLGGHLKANGWRFRSTTSHPAMINHRARSPLWRRDRLGHNSRHSGMVSVGSSGRITVAFEYVGPALVG